MKAQQGKYAQPSSPTLEVMIEWRETVMDVAHLTEGGGYTVGAEGDFDFAHPAIPPETRFTVASVRDGKVRIAVPPGVGGWTCFGEEVAPIDVVDAFQVVELEADARARVELGDLVVHCARVRPATLALESGPALVDKDTQRSVGAAALLHAVVLLMAWALPLDAATLTSDGFDPNERFANFVITPQQPKEDPFEALNKGDGEAGGGEDAVAAEEPPTPNAGGAPARKVDKKVEQKTRQMARAEAKAAAEDAMAALNGPQSSIFNDRGPLSERAAVAMNGLMDRGDGVGQGLGGDTPGLAGRGAGWGPGKSVGSGLSYGTCKDCDGPGSRGRYGRDLTRAGKHKPKAPPRVIPRKPIVVGGLTREIIQRVIRRNRSQYQFCYEKELNTHRDRSGKLVVKFTVGPNGRVIAARTDEDTVGGDVGACVIRKVRRWKFPAPQGGGIVNVRYPFLFKTSG